MYVYIYIYRERERERYSVYIYIYIYILTQTSSTTITLQRNNKKHTFEGVLQAPSSSGAGGLVTFGGTTCLTLLV